MINQNNQNMKRGMFPYLLLQTEITPVWSNGI